MQDLKINYEEMLEKDNNMDLEKWYESEVFSEKKKANSMRSFTDKQVFIIHIHM